jgi:hypothetical protein
MRNIFVLPTDKPSRLHNKNGELGNYPSTKLYIEDFKGNQYNSFHIYITSDEEIAGLEHNIWVIKGERILLWQNTMALVSNNKPRKIILTTDPDLIKDGVQEISENFLQWFLKNKACEYVEVKKVEHLTNKPYRVTIPEEEPKQDLEKDIFENLKEYYKTTPRKKVLQDWNKSAHLDKVGPTVDEFIENSNKEIFKNLKTISSKDIDPEFVDIVNDNFWDLIDNKETLEEAAEKYASKQSDNQMCTDNIEYSKSSQELWEESKVDFISGALSDAARDYWYEKFQNEK